MNETKKMLSGKQSQLDGLNGQSQKLKGLKSSWESLGDEKTLVETALPETENIDIYISELTSKASRSGILLSAITLAKGTVGAAGPLYVCGAVADGSLILAPSSAPAETVAGAPNISSNPASLSISCLKTINVSMTAKGTWEQLLDFFKYLEDMNRISNIGETAISVENQAQDQATSDLLSFSVSVNAFFKEGKQTGDAMLAASMANQGQLNQKAIEKLKTTIYAPYDAPAVSPSGQRNIFK
jgi:Tfp pilus assembly protein PilO